MEKGVGRSAFWEPWDCQQRANLGRLTDLWAALAHTLSLQTDPGYTGYQQLFSQRSCSYPFSTRYLTQKRDAVSVNTPEEDAAQQSC